MSVGSVPTFPRWKRRRKTGAKVPFHDVLRAAMEAADQARNLMCVHRQSFQDLLVLSLRPRHLLGGSAALRLPLRLRTATTELEAASRPRSAAESLTTIQAGGSKRRFLMHSPTRWSHQAGRLRRILPLRRCRWLPNRREEEVPQGSLVTSERWIAFRML